MPTQAKNIMKFFKGQVQNRIPLFQRPYKWGEDRWQGLWEDLVDCAGTGSTHFLGAIVSMELASERGEIERFLIIDGQQRLTTIAIMLCAVREFVDERAREKIYDLYLVNKHLEEDDPQSFLKLYPTRTDLPVFEALVRGQVFPDSTSNIPDAYRFFREKFDPERLDKDDLGASLTPLEILQKLESQLTVVEIALIENSDDPYEIFESLNGKSESLQASDLIRNFILMKFKPSNTKGQSEQQEVYEKLWRPLEIDLDASLTDFLFHYLRTLGQEVKRQRVYNAFRDARKNEKPSIVKTELERICRFGKRYKSFVDPSNADDPEMRGYFEALRALKVTTVYPIILKLYDELFCKNASEGDIKQSLKIIESFVVRRAVCNVKNNALDKRVIGMMQQWPSRGFPEFIYSYLSDGQRNLRWPKDDEFLEAFVYEAQYGRNLDQIVLERIDQYLSPKEFADGDNITVEHVMPQKLNQSWLEYLDESEEILNRYKDTFGNLTLTGLNSELGTKSFDEKVEIYRESRFKITRDITKIKAWNVEAIEARAKRLAACALKIWVGPAD